MLLNIGKKVNSEVEGLLTIFKLARKVKILLGKKKIKSYIYERPWTWGVGAAAASPLLGCWTRHDIFCSNTKYMFSGNHQLNAQQSKQTSRLLGVMQRKEQNRENKLNTADKPTVALHLECCLQFWSSPRTING